MYRKLLRYVNHFVYVEQKQLHCSYEGKMIDIDQDTLLLQTYNSDGLEDGVWVLPLSSITAFQTGSRDLRELALRVTWAESKDDDFERAVATMELVES